MITLQNTKKIQAKLLYDLLKKSFNEFFENGSKTDKSFNYGIGHNVISIELKDGTELYKLSITDDEITIQESAGNEKKVGERLQQFVEACLN